MAIIAWIIAHNTSGKNRSTICREHIGTHTNNHARFHNNIDIVPLKLMKGITVGGERGSV